MDGIRKVTPSESPRRAPGFFSLGDAPATPSPSTASTSRLPAPTPWKHRHLGKRILIAFAGTLFTVLLAAGSLAFLANLTLTRSLHFENRELTFFQSLREAGRGLFQKPPQLQGEAEGRINVLLLGRAGEKYPGQNLTDTVMILSLDTHAHRAALLSLPRDLFVPIPGTDLSTKLNALYQYGLSNGRGTDPVRESVAFVTGLPLPYVTIIDFEGFETVIDALDGITVNVPRDFYDPRYPGKNYSYETFELKSGWQKLDGSTALKYARERHNDPEGDFGRAKRQQQILQAVADRAFALPTFLNPFTLHDFLESLGQSITTNIEPGEWRRFLELVGTIDRHNVETVVVDAWKKESLLRVDHLDTQSGRAFILIPRSGNWDEIRDIAARLFEQERETLRKTKMAEEGARVHIVTSPAAVTAAERFKAALEKEFPDTTVTLSATATLNKSPETAIILDAAHLAKPYTLDALMKRFGWEKGEALPSGIPFPSDTDIVILFTQKTFQDPSPLIEFPDNNSYDFQEPLPPQKAR